MSRGNALTIVWGQLQRRVVAVIRRRHPGARIADDDGGAKNGGSLDEVRLANHRLGFEFAAFVVVGETLPDVEFRFEYSPLTQAGHIALDCPLSGTGAQAKARDLVVYASGDSAAIASCAGLFADFARQSADLGAYGNGSRMKFIANHLVAIHNVATAEAMLLAQCAGLDPKMVVDMVGPGAGGSRMFQMRAPMMVEGVYAPATMKVSMWEKDMAIIAEFAAAVGCATPLFTLTQPVYAQAMAMGMGEQDTASVFEVLKRNIVTGHG